MPSNIEETGEEGEPVLEAAEVVPETNNSKKREIYPDKWNQSRDYIFLKEKQYRGNWLIMQPTSVFRFYGNLTVDTISKMNQELKELLCSFQEKQAEGSI